MKAFAKGLAAGLLWTSLMGWPNPAWAQSPLAGGCTEAVTLLKAENAKLSGDLRRIQREIAALRADLDKPGLADVFAGIGYIVGLFGAAAFVAARRKE